MKNQIPKISEDVSGWYNAVIKAADLADHGPAKGTMVIKPYGFAIWELIQSALDEKIKAHGAKNAYFPLFIPMELLKKEVDHVEGFSPELAVVTHGGGEELEEPLAVRPTSETIIYHMFGKWIQSYRDLPYKINQWCNVVRWEKRTYMFMRTSEFLWQEGHTAHATHEDAINTQRWALEAYESIFEDYLAISAITGRKSTAERFAGADDTLTVEALMPSGKALQSATSHDLGQNFSKSFDITFQDDNGENQYVWQTSWGLSTRAIGGMILAHGDDNGLRLPPKVAPVQAAIVPVKFNDEVLKTANELKDQLTEAGVRVELDKDDGNSFGYRVNEWELKGAPIRLEVGPRELENNQVTIARRDTLKKDNYDISKTVEKVQELLEEIQKNLLAESKEFRESRTVSADNFQEFKKALSETQGFVRVAWNDDPEIEAKIKEETKAESRCMIEKLDESQKDFFTGEEAQEIWLFAKAY